MFHIWIVSLKLASVYTAGFVKTKHFRSLVVVAEIEVTFFGEIGCGNLWVNPTFAQTQSHILLKFTPFCARDILDSLRARFHTSKIRTPIHMEVCDKFP